MRKLKGAEGELYRGPRAREANGRERESRARTSGCALSRGGGMGACARGGQSEDEQLRRSEDERDAAALRLTQARACAAQRAARSKARTGG